MKRALFNLAALLSLFLFAALVQAWRMSPWGEGKYSEHRFDLRGDAYFIASGWDASLAPWADRPARRGR